MGKKKNVLVILVAVAVILAVGTTAMAAGDTLQAYVKNLKIIFNGQTIANDTQPVIINGSTYLPLRKLSVMFNKNISWDAKTQQITITDKPNEELQTLKNQLAEKDLQIQVLKAQLATKDDDDDDEDIDDLEDDLNDDYGDYEDLEWDIQLDGDKDDISVEIEIDLDDYDDEWNDLTTSDKEDFLQDICDDILDVFEDADIEGEIIDSSSDDTLLSFTVSSRGVVTISGVDLDDLEDDLTAEYKYYLDDIKLSVELDGDEDDITFYVNIDYNLYEDEWDNLSDDEINDLMIDIYEDIEDEYDDADILGYVYDTDGDEEMAKYNGSKFYRYLP